ncbi:MAG TPA: FtsX-like permease family protein [Rhodanobacteraceae bacterium]|nr:FtsX-like permease family protein [Rhodanobacteraceae bacterium]
MQLRPILATLRHHRLTTLLLALQVAFTCAIVCNVAFLIVNRVQRVTVPTGIAEDELSAISSTGIGKDDNPQARHQTDLAALRTIPGVTSAVAVSYSLPLNSNEYSTGTCPDRQALERAMQIMSTDGTGCLDASVYDGTPGLIATLGLRLVAGRDFHRDEYVATGKPAVAIISRALARRLYPGKPALGQTLYVGPSTMRVIGVVDTLLRPRLREPAVDYDSMIWPQLPSDNSVTYVLRSAPQDRGRVLRAAAGALISINPNRIISKDGGRTYTQIRAKYFRRDTTMIGLLIASAVGLLFVTALGITGLASFWVQQRTRTIGVRRALGATRGDILHYFQTENFLIVTFGIVPGIVLAVAINLTLMKFYELPHLSLFYLPVGAVALWTLGQLAVLHPALRAAAVPPVVATRTV